MLPFLWPRSRFFLTRSSLVYIIGSLLLFQGVLGAQEEALETTVCLPSQTMLQKDKDVLIRSKDILLYRVLEDREPAVKLQVSEVGTVFVPYYGELAVAGKTLEQIKTIFTLALESSLYKKATVFLSLEQDKDMLSPRFVYLGGKVNKVGPVALDPLKKNTVTKVILAAGGFADFADDSQVKLVRKALDTGAVQTFHVNVAAVLEKGELDQDLEVTDGDFIIVPKRLFNW